MAAAWCWEVILIAVSVSLDAFAVSIGGALCDRTGRMWRNAAWAALFFGGFQILMPLIGFSAGRLLRDIVAVADHWLAFGLLTLVGGKMIVEGIRFEPECGRKDEDGEERERGDFFAPKALLIPAIATSLDALAVGGGLAFAGRGIWVPALAMGVVTALLSATGVLLGRRIGAFAGERAMMIVGGCAIVLIGLKILIEHVCDF